MFLHFISLLLYYIYTHFHYPIFNFDSFLPKYACVNLVDLVKRFQTSIQYLVAKFDLDTTEKEPLKVSQESAKS